MPNLGSARLVHGEEWPAGSGRQVCHPSGQSVPIVCPPWLRHGALRPLSVEWTQPLAQGTPGTAVKAH